MSTPPEPPRLPAHLRPSTVEIPHTWTPEEALAVFELIDDLRDKICALYNLQLHDLLREQCAGRREDADDETLDHRPTRTACTPTEPIGIATGPDQKSSCCSINTAIPSSRPAHLAPTPTAAVKDGRRPPRSGASRP